MQRQVFLLAPVVLALLSATGLAQTRITTFPYTQTFNWVSPGTNTFPATGDGSEFGFDTAPQNAWTTSITTRGIHTNGGGTLRLQTVTAAPEIGVVWYGNFTGLCADTLRIDWGKISNSTAGNPPRINELRIATNGGSGAIFTDLPLANVADSAWPRFDNSATAQSGTLRLKLPASFNGASDARIRIYSINTGGSGNQPRVTIDNLVITALGSPPAGAIDSAIAITSSAITLQVSSGGSDSVLVIRSSRLPAPLPSERTSYNRGEGLNATDTVAFFGSAPTREIRLDGLQRNTLYYFALYTFRPCNSRFAESPAVGVFATRSIEIRSEPSGGMTCVGGPFTFTVDAAGNDLRYQWRKDGMDIPGATAPSYTIPSASLADSGSYTVLLTGMGISADPGGQLRPVPESLLSNPAQLMVKKPLAIATQPAGREICPGGTLHLQVEARGEKLTYQWRRNGTPVEGATSPMLTIMEASAEDEGIYDVIIRDACGIDETSTPATLTLYRAPAITVQPSDQVTCRTQPVTLRAEAAGSGLRYQWRKNGVPIPEATEASHTIRFTGPEDAGSYDVVVEGICPPAATSRAAQLTVHLEPIIREQPLDQTVLPGSRVTFRVDAYGTGALRYQWQKNGVDIPGATGPAYTIGSAGMEDIADYNVVIDNLCTPAPTVSNKAWLFVSATGSSITGPESRTICAGEPVTLRVEVSGTAARFQWRKDGHDIPGALAPELSIANASAQDAGVYACAISIAGNASAITPQATITVKEPAALIRGPLDQGVMAGDRVRFSVQVTGSELSYQWRKDGRMLPGATDSVLAIAAVTMEHEGIYDVVVTGPCGGLTSNGGVLTVESRGPASGVEGENDPATMNLTLLPPVRSQGAPPVAGPEETP